MQQEQKSEKIYFIAGENYKLPEEILKKYMGGIHCLCTEIPKE